jgi:hypothetical protein
MRLVLRALASLFVFVMLGGSLVGGAQAKQVYTKKSQTFYYKFGGACDDLTFTYREHKRGLKCYVDVYGLKPKKPKRNVYLAYWHYSEEEWYWEKKKKSNSSGKVRIYISPKKEDGYFCDCYYTYILYTNSTKKMKGASTDEFDIWFES